MARQNVIAKKKKRGPPATGKGEQIVVRMHPEQLAPLDAWIEDTYKRAVSNWDQRGPPPKKPTRPEAIRRLVEQALTSSRPADKPRRKP